jgi:hypothetical protein
VKPHVFHPAAGREYTEAAEYYSRIQGELGGRFYDEVEGLILDIRHQPERFQWQRSQPLRALCVLSWQECLLPFHPKKTNGRKRTQGTQRMDWTTATPLRSLRSVAAKMFFAVPSQENQWPQKNTEVPRRI